MGRWIASGAFLLLWLVPAMTAGAQTGGALMVDNSGSMRPYYSDGRIVDISRAIGEVLAAHGGASVHAFSDEVYPLRDVADLRGIRLGQFTYIDRALDYAIRADHPIVWIVTDNVESRSSAPEAADTEVFYHKLRGPEVGKIVIFPLRQPQGSAGLVIYALQLSAAADGTFEREVTEFAGRAKGVLRTEPLRMKPLDGETVQVSYERVNLKPKVRGMVVYQTGRDIREEVELRFKSRFEHLKIVDAALVVPPAAPEFSPGSPLKPERREIKISPERVTVDPQNETEQVYKVVIDLGEVRLKNDLASWWKSAWGGGGEDVDLRLSFVIQVPPENFHFRDDFLRDYHADTPQAAKESGKIYRLDRLPVLLSAARTEIAAGSSVPFRVEYPWKPALVFLGAGLLMLVLAGGLTFFTMRAGGNLLGRLGRWEVSAVNAAGDPLHCEVDGGRVLVRGDELGVIRGGTFAAAEGVRLDGGSGQVKLKDGLRLRAERKGRQSFLIFKRAAGGDGGGRPQPPRPEPASPAYKPRTR